MDEQLVSFNHESLNALTHDDQQAAINALESGQVIYFPNYSFSKQFPAQELLSEKILDGKHKNISYDYRNQRLGGYHPTANLPMLKTFMHHYAEYTKELIETLIPQYREQLHWGRTSYRPAEIKGRVSSKRKDDTRLHVDSFPATPVNGNRILRVFCNINPDNQPRVWHLGEPFSTVLDRFATKLPKYSLNKAKLLKLIKATKTLRSAYDHYQLHLHDQMKLDDGYQQTVNKKRFDFPAQSTWIVFTDQVSHAALSGQYLLEQTFYLPVEAMAKPEFSPLKKWQKMMRHKSIIFEYNG